MVSPDGAEILARALRAKAQQRARDLVADHVPAAVWARNQDAIEAGIEAGITGLVLALVDVGIFPAVKPEDDQHAEDCDCIRCVVRRQT